MTNLIDNTQVIDAWALVSEKGSDSHVFLL